MPLDVEVRHRDAFQPSQLGLALMIHLPLKKCFLLTVDIRKQMNKGGRVPGLCLQHRERLGEGPRWGLEERGSHPAEARE